MPPHSKPARPVCSDLFFDSSALDWLVKGAIIVVCIVVIQFLQKRRKMTTPSKVDDITTSENKKDSLPSPPTSQEDCDQPTTPERVNVQPTFVYPWIAPPAPLPGPYDPMYFPLPMPTIRHHSYEEASSDHDAEPDFTTTADYSRRISTMTNPTKNLIIEGRTTTSQQGWRRNHWTVTGG